MMAKVLRSEWSTLGRPGVDSQLSEERSRCSHLGIERQWRCKKKASWADKLFSLFVATAKEVSRLFSAFVKPLVSIGAPSNIALEVVGSMKLIIYSVLSLVTVVYNILQTFHHEHFWTYAHIPRFVLLLYKCPILTIFASALFVQSSCKDGEDMQMFDYKKKFSIYI